MKKIILISTFFFLYCNQLTMLDVYREYLPIHEEGFVREIEMYKSGGYLLKIENYNERESIAVSKKIGEFTNVGDHFTKLENSNKCQLKRKDSIICLDCLIITEKERDSLGEINEWKKFEKNHWKVIEKAGH